MYLQHFALTRYPFQTMDHPDELFKSKAGSETETRLLHLLELRGIGLLTGEVGCGKTTACRQVTAGLHPGLYRVYYVSLTTGSILDTYQVIAWELGLATERSRATAYRAIRTELSRLAKEAKQLPVLVIDEAQHLRNDVLEDLRLLTSFNMDAEHRLCLLLVGLSELRRRLSMAVHESLSQRIVMRHHLGGLLRDELEPLPAAPAAPGRLRTAAVRACRDRGPVPGLARPCHGRSTASPTSRLPLPPSTSSTPSISGISSTAVRRSCHEQSDRQSLPPPLPSTQESASWMITTRNSGARVPAPSAIAHSSLSPPNSATTRTRSTGRAGSAQARC